jgi:hypothetical protein
LVDELCAFSFFAATISRSPDFLNTSLSHAAPRFHVGRYQVSPLSRRQPDGAWLASVSIRSGHGSTCTDRIFRFTHPFPSQESACDYARTQGLIWIDRTEPRPTQDTPAWSA